MFVFQTFRLTRDLFLFSLIFLVSRWINWKTFLRRIFSSKIFFFTSVQNMQYIYSFRIYDVTWILRQVQIFIVNFFPSQVVCLLKTMPDYCKHIL